MNRDAISTPKQVDDEALLTFFRVIASGDLAEVSRLDDSTPGIAISAIRIAASHHDATTYFLDTIRHYVYSGDTALHIAAAANQVPTAKSMVGKGANVRARNRRGAEPLHYAADSSPGAAYWDPRAQYSIIEYLIRTGADPNACDISGVAALHRAVRTRSAAAVRALLDNGANLRLMNKSGSTPFHLAVQNTGRSDSGSMEARDQQGQIIELLLQRGARPTDRDAKGKTVESAAANDWIRALLA